MDEGQQQVTQLLLDWQKGNREALDQLLPIVYDELRKLAIRQLKNERDGHTLQPTALIHETYLRLAGQDFKDWKNRAHFFGVSAHLMRQILVDNARKHRSSKRGGKHQKVPLNETVIGSVEKAPALIALDDAMEALQKLDPRKCQVIELRYFAGMNTQEISEALNISTATVGRDLRMAELWLMREMGSP